MPISIEPYSLRATQGDTRQAAAQGADEPAIKRAHRRASRHRVPSRLGFEGIVLKRGRPSPPLLRLAQV
jgi:hypothetical protein